MDVRTCVSAFALIAIPSVVYAQETPAPAAEATSPFSGSVAVRTNNIDYDGFVYNNKVIVEINVALDLGGGFTATADIFKGVTQEEGDESDFAIAYATEVAPNVDIGVTLARYSFSGPDITAAEVEIASGPVAVLASFYRVDGKDEDAFRFNASYTVPVTEKFEVSAFVVYETGFDLADIATVGAELSYQLSERVAIEAQYVQPVIREKGDPRDRRFSIGVSFSF